MAFDPITAVFDIGGKLIDRLWPNPQEADAARLKLLEMQQSGELAKLAAETDLLKGQQAINLEEAKNANIWVSGARPFFMWVCGAAFAYHYVLQPFLAFVMASAGHPVTLPAFNMEYLMTVAMGMLGLGGMRTFEKTKGVAK